MSETPMPPTGGHRDAKAEAKAAKAYAKAQRPWFKKKRFVIPLAFVAIAIIGGALSDSESPSGTSTDSGSTGNTVISAPKDSAAGSSDEPASNNGSDAEEPSVTAEASSMVKEFQDNELAADAKYKGKWVQVNGVVDKIDTEMFNSNKYVLNIGGGSEFEFLTVNCHDIPQSELSKIAKGDDVTVVGKFQDGGDVGVELKKCRVS